MDKDTKVEDKNNEKLGTFADELKALLDKHNVAIEVQSQIVAVDLSKRNPATTLDVDKA